MRCRQNRKNLAAKPARTQAKLTQIVRGSTHSIPLNSNDDVLQCSSPCVGEALRTSGWRRWGLRTALDDWFGLGCLSAANLLVNGKLWVRVPQPAAAAYDKIEFANEGTTRADWQCRCWCRGRVESSRVELRLRGCRQLLVFSRWRWTRSGKAKSLSENIHNILLENKFLNKQNIFKSAKTQARVISSVCVRAAETKHFQVPKRARVAYVT